MVGLDEARKEHRAETWWAFSSTSKKLDAAGEFLGDDEKRVVFIVDGGSSARDIREYSAYEAEDELLLPAGTAFEVRSASSPAEGLIHVSLVQTEASLLQTRGNKQLAAFARELDADGAAGEEVVRTWRLCLPVPPGLMAVVISRCVDECGDNPTSVWRRDLVTIAHVARAAPRVRGADEAAELATLDLFTLETRARDMWVAPELLVPIQANEEATLKEVKQALIGLIANVPLRVELCVGQRDKHCVEIKARAMIDGLGGGASSISDGLVLRPGFQEERVCAEAIGRFDALLPAVVSAIAEDV